MSWLIGKSQTNLPEATGPFVPGCTDVLLDYSKDGILMRLYYPTDAKKTDPRNSSRYYPWMPEDSYIRGFAKVLMTFTIFMRIAFWWCSSYIPVLYGAKIQTLKVDNKKFKCIVVSHGLGGTRWLYSNTCCELASRGFVVVALEHRDNSACHTFYYNSKEEAQSGQFTPIEYVMIQFGKNHFDKRSEQVHQRAKECEKALDFLINLNKGKVPCNILTLTPNCRKIEFSLENLVDKIDINNITIMGHSFGGSTALLALNQRPEFKQGILLDPWMFPIKNLDLDLKVKQPLLFVNTQTFHISTNVNSMSKYLTDEKKRQMFTILHTTHESQTDTPLLVGFWLNWFMKKLDIETALRINSGLILEFLDTFVGCPSDIGDCRQFVEEQKENVEAGLTKAWA